MFQYGSRGSNICQYNSHDLAVFLLLTRKELVKNSYKPLQHIAIRYNENTLQEIFKHTTYHVTSV
jgi:hypothetical protein